MCPQQESANEAPEEGLHKQAQVIFMRMSPGPYTTQKKKKEKKKKINKNSLLSLIEVVL